MDSQSTSTVFMIRPQGFGFNEQTAESNAFQKRDTDGNNTQEIALAEFDRAVDLLLSNGVNVFVFEDTLTPHKPDAIFPNNWISTHPDGTIFLYPMAAENRRAERRADIIQKVRDEFDVRRINDLSFYEKDGKFLEGTGSVVLDRINKIAYACLSIRTAPDPLNEFARLAGYELVTFNAVDDGGFPIYHTNVMFCIGEKFAVVCLDTIENESERKKVVESLTTTGKDIVQISSEQLKDFAANMLQLRSKENEELLLMSERAFKALSQPQIVQLQKFCRIIYTPLNTIEEVGGGSARCMVAELHLPLK